ncbi:MAG: hypothetical protein ABIA59_04690 [Candidatus Latescibacterota bacterium]
MPAYPRRQRRDADDDYSPYDKRKRNLRGKKRSPKRNESIPPLLADDEFDESLLEDEDDDFLDSDEDEDRDDSEDRDDWAASDEDDDEN